METNQTELLPGLSEMPADQEQNMTQDRKIQIEIDTQTAILTNDANMTRNLSNAFLVIDMREIDTQAANVKRDADMARNLSNTLPVIDMRENAQYPTPVEPESTRIRMPCQQKKEVEGDGWQVVKDKRNKKNATSSDRYKQAEPGARRKRHGKSDLKLQGRNANLKGGATAVFKATATPLPTGRVISSESPTIPIFVNVAPENKWIKRMTPVIPQAQVNERTGNGGDKTPDEGLSRDSSPLDKVEGNDMTLHERVVEDLKEILRETRQIFKETRKMMKKERQTVKGGQDPTLGWTPELTPMEEPQVQREDELRNRRDIYARKKKARLEKKKTK